MQRRDGIGKYWANKVLKHGYQSYNKEPNKTKAKIWNQKAEVFEEIELSSDTIFKFKNKCREGMIK